MSRSSLLWFLGDPLARVGSSAKLFGSLIFKVIFALVPKGVHWPKQVLSAKFGVLVFMASLLWNWGGGHWPK